MGVHEAVAGLHAALAAQVEPLDPLEMAVTAALGCVAPDDIFGPAPATPPADTDSTALLAPIRPIVPAGSLVTAWHQQVLLDAGLLRVNVIPRPRVVVLGIDSSAGPARTMALASTCTLAGALTLTVSVSASADVGEVIDDQLARADLLLVCEVPGAPGGAAQVLRQQAGQTLALWTSHSLPTVTFAVLGPQRVPALVLPAEPAGQLLAFALAALPLISRLQGLPVPAAQRASIAASTAATGDAGDSGATHPGVSNRDAADAHVTHPGVSNRDGADADVTHRGVAKSDAADADVAHPGVSNRDAADGEIPTAAADLADAHASNDHPPFADIAVAGSLVGSLRAQLLAREDSALGHGASPMLAELTDSAGGCLRIPLPSPPSAGV